MKNPIVVTTMTEDFRKIGILDEQTPTPEAEQDDDSLTERRVRRAVSRGGRKKVTQHKTDPLKLRQGRIAARKPAAKRGRRMLTKKHKKSARWNRRQVALRRMRGECVNGLTRVSSLIEDVQGIVAGIENTDRQESMKTFANIAIISEMLATGFRSFADQIEDDEQAQQDFANAADAFAEMADDAAQIATGINEANLDATDEDIAEEFKAMMKTLLDGLDLYSDVTEASDEDEDEDEEDSEEEDSEEDGEGEDEGEGE